MAVVALGTTFFFVFRQQISGILQRTKRIGKGGLETSVPSQQIEEDKDNDPLSEFLSTFDNPLVKDQEARILSDLDSRGLTDQRAAQRALVRSLASAQIRLHFEQVIRLIWGSQIAALTYLGTRFAAVPAEEVKPLYDRGAQQFPDLFENYPFEGWLNFLLGKHLISKEDGNIILTLVGREFLKWRIEIQEAGPFHG